MLPQCPALLSFCSVTHCYCYTLNKLMMMMKEKLWTSGVFWIMKCLGDAAHFTDSTYWSCPVLLLWLNLTRKSPSFTSNLWTSSRGSTPWYHGSPSSDWLYTSLYTAAQTCLLGNNTLFKGCDTRYRNLSQKLALNRMQLYSVQVCITRRQRLWSYDLMALYKAIITLIIIIIKFLVPETFKHSWPIKPHNFGHVPRCKCLVQVFWAYVTPIITVSLPRRT